MQQQNSNPVDPAVRRRQTNVKAAQGTFFLSLIMSAVYIARIYLRQSFNFFFCWFLPETLMRSAAFTQQYDDAFSAPYSEWFKAHLVGKLPGTVLLVLSLAVLALALATALFVTKKPKFLWLELILYGIDSALLLCGRLFAVPSPMTENGWIDVIFHAIILLLLVIGTVSHKKLGAAEAQGTK